MMPTSLFTLLTLLTHTEFVICVAAMEENDNKVANFFVFLPANSCDYEDAYSNCKQLKDQLGCEDSLTKDNCKASCNCPDKIY